MNKYYTVYVTSSTGIGLIQTMPDNILTGFLLTKICSTICLTDNGQSCTNGNNY
jgi:hypothetical protein